jgi:hypothetical protein
MMSFKEDWENGWKIIGQMGGCTPSQTKDKALIGCLGISGLSLLLFGGVWFYIAVCWFVLFGVLLVIK